MKFYENVEHDGVTDNPDAVTSELDKEDTVDAAVNADEDDPVQESLKERFTRFARSDKGRVILLVGLGCLILLLLGGGILVNILHNKGNDDDFITKGAKEVSEQVRDYLDTEWPDMNPDVKENIVSAASSVFAKLMTDGFDYTDPEATKATIVSMLGDQLGDYLSSLGYSGDEIKDIFNNVADIIWNVLNKYGPVSQGSQELVKNVTSYLDKEWPDMDDATKEKVTNTTSTIFEYIMNNGFDPEDEVGTKDQIMQMLKDMLYEYLKEMGYSDSEIEKLFTDLSQLIWDMLEKYGKDYNATPGQDGKDGKDGVAGAAGKTGNLTTTQLIKTVDSMTELEKETMTQLLGISREELEQLLEGLKTGTNTDILQMIENLTEEDIQKLLELLGIADLTELQAMIDELRTMIEELDLENNLSEINNNFENITTDVNNKYEELTNTVNNKYDELTSEINNKYDELNSTIQNSVTELTNKIDETTNSLTELINGNTKEIENVRTELTNTRDELEDLMNALNQETNEYFQYLCDNLNSTIVSLAEMEANDIRNIESQLVTTRDLLSSLIKDDFIILKSLLTGTTNKLKEMITENNKILKEQINSNWNKTQQADQIIKDRLDDTWDKTQEADQILKDQINNISQILKDQIDSNWNAVLSMMKDQYTWTEEDGETMLIITTPVVPEAPAWEDSPWDAMPNMDEWPQMPNMDAWPEFSNPVMPDADPKEDPTYPGFEKSDYTNSYN